MGTGLVLGAFALAGCATPGYSPSRVQSELEHAGATPAQARCVATNLPGKFDLNQLGSHSAPSLRRQTPTATDPPGTDYGNEYEKTREIIVKTCKITLPLNPLPTPQS